MLVRSVYSCYLTGRPRTYYKSSPESLDSFLATRMSSPAPSTSSIRTAPKIVSLGEKHSAAGMIETGDGAGENREGASRNGERRGSNQDSELGETANEEGEKLFKSGEMLLQGKKHQVSIEGARARLLPSA